MLSNVWNTWVSPCYPLLTPALPRLPRFRDTGGSLAFQAAHKNLTLERRSTPLLAPDGLGTLSVSFSRRYRLLCEMRGRRWLWPLTICVRTA
jgi:hypothetical protein